MRKWAAGLALGVGVVLSAGAARAYDVTSEQARKQSLLEYVAGRTDLAPEDREAWDKAVRLSFGGKAKNDGTDEGVTVAKSVIAGAIFFGIAPKDGAKAAYDAYHDTFSWVPPPLAINYQLLTFQGRKPSVSAKRLAFSFPKYFNEELAPEVVVWWAEMLSTGKVAEWERPQIEELLAATRVLMRPMLLAMLRRGAELESRRASTTGADRAEVEKALAALEKSIGRSFVGVARDPKVQVPGPFYERYARLAKELGNPPAPRPKAPTGPAAPPPRASSVEVREPATPPKATPTPPPVPVAEAATAAREEERRRSSSRIPAPFPGDPLVEVYTGWMPSLSRTVEGWLGVPYLWGGLTKNGVDCSGFVREVFRESLNIELPRNSRAQFETGRGIAGQGELKPGDVVFFDTLDRGQVTHVAVYLGDGEFAHASSSRGVTRDKLGKKYYQRAYWGARRLLKL